MLPNSRKLTFEGVLKIVGGTRPPSPHLVEIRVKVNNININIVITITIINIITAIITFLLLYLKMSTFFLMTR